jgi:hypothetical protein
MKREPDYAGAADVLAGLKDFQLRTVDYVFERLYGDDDPVRRFLVADEVGLGKTLVARGVIAKAIEHLQANGVKRVDVVYICSNAEIARQNIKKLNVTGDEDFQLASRITLLPMTLKELTRRRLNFASFTPGTSFELRSNMGMAQERVVLYWLLHKAWGAKALRGAGPLKVLRGAMRMDRFGQRVKWFDPGTLDRGLTKSFSDALAAHDREAKAAGVPMLRSRFTELASSLARRRRPLTRNESYERSSLIGDLRGILARTCVDALEPDLIVLDEFQRFRDLLDGDDSAADLARALFDHPDARVLLLSATPYKMVTLTDEAGDEDHHTDFVRTLRFLLGDEGAEQVDGELRRFRRALLGGADGGIDLAAAHSARAAAQEQIRRAMSRTERLAVKSDRNGMLIDRQIGDIRLEVDDVKRYIALDRLSTAAEAGDVVEYWKSAPYLVNFMDSYQLVRRLHGGPRGDAGASIAAALAAVDDLISWDDIAAYQAVDPGNARLRAVADDVFAGESWRWLWLPPTLPYYEPGQGFDRPEAERATKRLVFSSWAVVPKVVAALLSYEAERLMVTSQQSRPIGNTPEERRRVGQLLRFTQSGGRLTGMPVFALLYPSPTLSAIGDPLRFADATVAVTDRHALLREVGERLMERLGPWLEFAASTGPTDDAWYWAAPMLLDRGSPDGYDDDAWWEQAYGWRWSGDSDDDSAAVVATGEVRSSFDRHLEEADRRIEDVLSGEAPLGRPPADLGLVLSLLAVASPANTAMRALGRASQVPLPEVEVRNAAAQVAWAFRSLFNLPEVTLLLRGSNPDDTYWKGVLDYCVNGNLQAVLDEFAHVLPDRLGILDAGSVEALDAMRDAMRDAITVRTVSYSCHDVESDGNRFRFRQGEHRMRGRFALRFGQDRIEESNDSTRTTAVRDAFNSPFWPFVLATTSVGQEGLDFHQYCHACIHWNLPANPVDLEQREGRVHRYKGHAVRKNLADRHASDGLVADDPWTSMFDAAVRARPVGVSDLEPYWVLPGRHAIERIVPMLPLSREVQRFEALRRSVAAYRLVIGQPRQEELLAYLNGRYTVEELEQLLDDLQIDLSPP